MTHAQTQTILAMVRKILALAESPAATEHEAVAGTAEAAALVAAYGIDRALLAAADPGSDPIGDVVIALDRPWATDEADLLFDRGRPPALHGGAAHPPPGAGQGADDAPVRPRQRSRAGRDPVHQPADAERRPARPRTRARRRASRGLPQILAGGLPSGDQPPARRCRAAGRGLRRGALPQRRPIDRPGPRGQVAGCPVRSRGGLSPAGDGSPAQPSGSGSAAGWAAGQRADLGAPRVSTRRGELE